MPVGALYFDLRVVASTSLKDKRMVVRHILDVARQRFSVAAAEIDHQDLRQHAGIGFAVISGDPAQIEAVFDALERFVWSNPEVEVIEATRHWLDDND